MELLGGSSQQQNDGGSTHSARANCNFYVFRSFWQDPTQHILPSLNLFISENSTYPVWFSKSNAFTREEFPSDLVTSHSKWLKSWRGKLSPIGGDRKGDGSCSLSLPQVLIRWAWSNYLGWPQTACHMPVQMGTSDEQPKAAPGLLQTAERLLLKGTTF